ncbi:MAG: IS3 family transposase [Bacilli bacterium]|nr:IS3 family transposase [Bacilli bacterium]
MSKYREKLEELKITQSMSRKGNCLDDSPTENFFGRMKEEMFFGKENLYEDMNQLKKAIHNYINYYNNERIVTRLMMSPVQYRIETFGLI